MLLRVDGTRGKEFLLLGKDIEMACDEQVLRENATLDRVEYARALLACSSESHKFYVCPVAFGESGVEGRGKNVLNYKKPGFWLVVIAVVVCVAVAVCFLTNPISKSNEQNNPRRSFKKDLFNNGYSVICST